MKPASRDTPPHTPGPWAIDRDDRPGMAWNNHIVQAERPHMAICFMTHSGKPDNSEAEANARLIAAAPELLNACVQAEAAMSIVRPSSDAAEYRRILSVVRIALKSAGWEIGQ